jgi:error-prone DNA polymerase
VRLGLRQVRGLKKANAERLITARQAGARTLHEIAAHADLSRQTLELLAEADALRSVGLDRRAALWAVKGLAPEVKAQSASPLLALMGAPAERAISLPAMALPAHVAEDYRTTSLSLKAHPCGFFRPALTRLGAVKAAALKSMADGRKVSVAGLVLIRQRPGTAKGVVFITLEDETGSANAVVWRDVFTANRRAVMSAAFLVVHGRLQRAGDVIHVVAERFTDLSARLAEMKTAEGEGPGPSPSSPARLVRSRDFH